MYWLTYYRNDTNAQLIIIKKRKNDQRNKKNDFK